MSNLTLTINSNREIVAEQWSDLWQDAGFTDTFDSDKALVNYYVTEFTKHVQQSLDCEVRYQDSFQYWRGGPGHLSNGLWILRDSDNPRLRYTSGAKPDVVDAANAMALALVRVAVLQEIEEINAALEAEA